MTNLPATIRILGVPWAVTGSPVPDPNEPDAAACHDWRTSTITLCTDVPGPLQLWHLWERIVSIVYSPLIWGKAVIDDATLSGVANCLYAVIRDNTVTVGQWFGWGGQPPLIQDCHLRILGLVVDFRCVPHIRGLRCDVRGQSRMGELIIEVLRGIESHSAAEVALHELVHAALQPLYQVGNIEAFVAPLSAGLAQVLADNPEAMQRMFEE